MNKEDALIPSIISIPPIKTPHKPHRENDHDHSVFTKYINNTGRTIYVIRKNGGVFPIPYRNTTNRHEFIIRKETYVSERMKGDMKQFMIDKKEGCSADLIEFSKDYMEAYNQSDIGVNVRQDYSVSVAELNFNNGSIYHVEEDIIISLTPDSIIHPNSLAALEKYPKYATSSYSGIEFKIIDNTESIGPRYTRVLSQVVKIPNEYDALLPNGLHIMITGLHDSRKDSPPMKSIFLPFEEMEVAPYIFKTFTEAKNSPEGDLAAKIELIELERDIKKQALEYSRLKADSDRELLEVGRERDELQRKYDEAEILRKTEEVAMQRKYDEIDHKSKMVQLQSRDYYEGRSATRKDSSEIIKVLPALVAGAAAVFLAVRTAL